MAHKGFTSSQVREILLSRLTDAAMAGVMGCSRQAIRAIRTGKNYSHLFPDIERRISRQVLCDKCVFYQKGSCDLGIPESGTGHHLSGYHQQHIGKNYAKQCSTFVSST